MKNIRYYIIFIVTILLSSGCEDYLTVLPENNQSSYDYWNTKEEVEAVLGAGYVKMRGSIETIFLWGEARGNGISFEREGESLQKAAKYLRDFNIQTNNALAKWGEPYKVISMANSVIKYGPSVVEKDPSFDVNVMNSFLSEAYFLRSLAYFYLVRTFQDVPLVTEPYVDDSAPYSLAKAKGDSILDRCIEDLKKSLPTAKEFFPESSFTSSMNSKGRATRWALHALLADIYLWRGDYQLCIEHCDEVLNSGRVGLISQTQWFTNYYPGNSNESIFELQYSYNLNQTNSFLEWFSSDFYYKISDYSLRLFQGEQKDIRADVGSYNSTENNKIWKYVGKDALSARDAGREKDQNYIIYRLAEIHLMKAEAYIMLGLYDEAIQSINIIRNRAGINNLEVAHDKFELTKALLYERQREFIAEGKSWFDILRIGRRSEMGDRDARFKSLMVDQVLEEASTSKISLIRASLQNSGSWYLPIHQDELNANPLLEQSEYYKSISK